MKTLLAAIALGFGLQMNAQAHQDLEVFIAKVKAMNCDEERPISKLSGTCLFTVQSQESEGAELVGLVIHSDLYWDGGKFIRVGDPVRVDLSYTTRKTAELRPFFPKNVSRIYFHDNITSQGSYSDVISRERRE
jgi:hypothetical protein